MKRQYSKGHYGTKEKSIIIKTIVNNINLECVKPSRGGIILYTVVNDAVYFGLGLDSHTHDLTDFGGSIYYPVDKNVIDGAIREFQEETLEIFEPITKESIGKCPVIYDDNNLVIFMMITIDPNIISSQFNNKYKSCSPKEPEVCCITWLTWEEFQQSINVEGIMFSRLQKFLNKAGDFSYLL